MRAVDTERRLHLFHRPNNQRLRRIPRNRLLFRLFSTIPRLTVTFSAAVEAFSARFEQIFDSITGLISVHISPFRHFEESCACTSPKLL
jgi:hypothetical protein